MQQDCKLFNVLMSILVFSSCVWKLIIVNWYLWSFCCIIKWSAISYQLLQHSKFLLIFLLKHPPTEASEEQDSSQALSREGENSMPLNHFCRDTACRVLYWLFFPFVYSGFVAILGLCLPCGFYFIYCFKFSRVNFSSWIDTSLWKLCLL